MKTFQQTAAQGDVLFIKIEKIPEGLTEVQPQNGKHIIAHSETGHNHTMTANKAKLFRPDDDAFVGFISVNETVDLTHERTFDTHEALRFSPGNYEIRRQREYSEFSPILAAD